MRQNLMLLILAGACNAFAQAPPITVEWSALRPYPSTTGANAQITRDNVNYDYLWAVMGTDIQTDERANVFLPDGTDVTPSYPGEFNVGSLDFLQEVELCNGNTYNLMRHQLLGGVQPVNWHVRSTFGTNDWDLWLTNPINSADFSEVGLDLLVTDNAVYSCGLSGDGISSSIPRVLKTDLQGNVIWNVTWDPVIPVAVLRFSSVAELGDTVVCAMFPEVVLFHAATGAYIDIMYPDPTGSLPWGDGPLLTHGDRIYWSVAAVGYLHAGWFDPASGQSDSWYTSVGPALSVPEIVIDQYDHIWLGCTTANTGYWFRLGLDLTPIDSGTLYESIDDMCFVNGKISFTGVLDAATSTAYVVTGTPQP